MRVFNAVTRYAPYVKKNVGRHYRSVKFYVGIKDKMVFGKETGSQIFKPRCEQRKNMSDLF